MCACEHTLNEEFHNLYKKVDYMPNTNQVSIKNLLLAALPRRDYQQMLPFLKPVDLAFRDTLYEPNTRIRYVYFPVVGFLSMLSIVDNVHAAEVGLVGNEGMAGFPVALGAAITPFRIIVQGAGSAMRMKVADFRREFDASPALRKELFLFTHKLMIQVAQTAACNNFHSLQNRMARWLLMTHDRVDSDDFPITQEFLALMLGVRRVGITLASGILQGLGLISSKRGTITILDRKGLEAEACTCYKVVQDTYALADSHHKAKK